MSVQSASMMLALSEKTTAASGLGAMNSAPAVAISSMKSYTSRPAPGAGAAAVATIAPARTSRAANLYFMVAKSMLAIWLSVLRRLCWSGCGDVEYWRMSLGFIRARTPVFDVMAC